MKLALLALITYKSCMFAVFCVMVLYTLSIGIWQFRKLKTAGQKKEALITVIFSMIVAYFLSRFVD